MKKTAKRTRPSRAAKQKAEKAEALELLDQAAKTLATSVADALARTSHTNISHCTFQGVNPQLSECFADLAKGIVANGKAAEALSTAVLEAVRSGNSAAPLLHIGPNTAAVKLS
jgi:hypothetical protein